MLSFIVPPPVEGVNAVKRFWTVFSFLVSVTILIYIIYYQRTQISRKVRQNFWPDVPVADIKLDFTQSQKRTHSDSSNKSGQFHGICILCSSTNIKKCKKDHYHSMTASNRNSELLDDNTDLLGADMLARKRIKGTDLPNVPFQRIPVTDEVRDTYDHDTVPETEGIYGTYQGNLSSAWSDGNHSQLDPTVKLTTDHYETTCAGPNSLASIQKSRFESTSYKATKFPVHFQVHEQAEHKQHISKSPLAKQATVVDREAHMKINSNINPKNPELSAVNILDYAKSNYNLIQTVDDYTTATDNFQTDNETSKYNQFREQTKRLTKTRSTIRKSRQNQENMLYIENCQFSDYNVMEDIIERTEIDSIKKSDNRASESDRCSETSMDVSTDQDHYPYIQMTDVMPKIIAKTSEVEVCLKSHNHERLKSNYSSLTTGRHKAASIESPESANSSGITRSR